MKKSLISLLLCLGMVSALVAGCGSSAGGGKTEGGTESTGSTEGTESAGTNGNTLTIPVSATVTTLNPLLDTMAEGKLQLSPFSDELYYMEDDETRYYLAESCEVSEDGLTYTLKLKDNLKWHDGEPITADDVIFTAIQIMEQDLQMWYSQEKNLLNTRK